MSNPYEEYLEATKEPAWMSAARHLARYTLAKAGSTMLLYPWESVILLRQLQCPDSAAKISPVRCSPPPRPIEERRRAYEEYLLRPQSFDLKSLEQAREEETVDTFTNWLSSNDSLVSCVRNTIKMEGVASLWQGGWAWNIRRIASDIISDGLLMLPRGTESLLVEATLQSAESVLLNPLEVAWIRLTVQSPYPNTRTYHNGILSVFRQSSLRELFTGWHWGALARLVESLVTAGISRLGCALVDHIAKSSTASYAFLATGYFLVNALALNAPLLISMPLDCIRRRAALPVHEMPTRVPVRPGWRITEQLAQPRQLYHGWTMRVACNTSILLLDLLSELEGEWLGGDEEF